MFEGAHNIENIEILRQKWNKYTSIWERKSAGMKIQQNYMICDDGNEAQMLCTRKLDSSHFITK